MVQAAGIQSAGRQGREEAFSIWRRESLDLLISDVRLNGGSGIDLARRLKAVPEPSPLVVFVTGYADLSNEEAYDVGACAILNKPINRGDLVRAVERFLRPLCDRWATPVEVQPKEHLRRHFASLESALTQREFSFGRGGIFVRGSESACEFLPIRFEFSFDEGPMLRMDGCGISRWQRIVPLPSLPAGTGIEIVHIDDHARQRITELISSMNTKAFIPKA